jgi:hypothetical protein
MFWAKSIAPPVRGPERKPKPEKAMKEKRIPRPERLRRPPRQFSWLDHRLVRENRLGGCSAEALALYLFLATVADAEGLSYYGEAAITRHLNLDASGLRAARACLIREELIAYEAPFYQVLSLDGGPVSSRSEPASGRSGRALSLAELLSELEGGVS